MSKKDKQNWLAMAAEATEVAADHLDNGNINAAADWHEMTLRRAAVAQAEAQTRLADNSDRIAVALERIAEPIDANIEAQENVIIALGLNPSDFKTDLMDHVINGVIGAMTQRLAELEAAQQWRPVTEEWPPCDLKVVISAPGASWAEVASKHYDGDEYVWELENGHAFDFESATVALPLPQEPTP